MTIKFGNHELEVSLVSKKNFVINLTKTQRTTTLLFFLLLIDIIHGINERRFTNVKPFFFFSRSFGSLGEVPDLSLDFAGVRRSSSSSLFYFNGDTHMFLQRIAGQSFTSECHLPLAPAGLKFKNSKIWIRKDSRRFHPPWHAQGPIKIKRDLYVFLKHFFKNIFF